MEGGNEASAASGITHSPLGEQNAARRACQNDAAEKLPRMDSALGVLLDGAAVKKMRKPPKNSRTWKAASSRWFADASSALLFKLQRKNDCNLTYEKALFLIDRLYCTNESCRRLLRFRE